MSSLVSFRHTSAIGQVGDGAAIECVGEILTPFIPGEVTVGNPAGDALPGVEIDVPHDHATVVTGATVSDRDRLAVGTEDHAVDAAILEDEWFAGEAFSCGHVPHQHAAHVSGRDGLAVRTKGHAVDHAFLDGERFCARRSRVAASHRTTPPTPTMPYPAAMVLPSRLKDTLETAPSLTASGSATGVSVGHVPEYYAAEVDGVCVIRPRSLAVRAKNTLETPPSLTARGLDAALGCQVPESHIDDDRR